MSGGYLKATRSLHLIRPRHTRAPQLTHHCLEYSLKQGTERYLADLVD